MSKDYETGRIPMKSGIGEVYERVFKKVQGKRLVWFIAIQENPADNVYCYDPKNPNRRGFGGREMEFTLENESVERVKGPSHSNSGSLFEDTGIDVRNMHLTKVVLGLNGAEYLGGHNWKMKNPIYKEDKHKLGSYGRGEDLAQEYANKLGKRIYYWIESMGGASGHFKDPEIKTNEVIRIC